MAELTPVGDVSWSLRSGSLEVCMARTPAEVEAAQALRYSVFYRERAARPSQEMEAAERDWDAFDDVADHLLVIDNARGRGSRGVVGTYRLIRRDAAARMGRFYSADEYDIGKLVDYPGEILELGRSCVHADYRNGYTMNLLWRGITAYVFENEIEVMFGCASLPGCDPDELALPLSYLWHYSLAPPALRPRALPHRFVDMRRMPVEKIDQRAAMTVMPPLIKGYLRLGGMIGDGAVVDYQFNTTDVCVIVKTEMVTEKYIRHYERSERRPVLVHPRP
ncbi:MAG: GNAT family N-acetyltransferase [Rhodospirillaceae bacterium]|nr:GNAT family N-acetyltransferase [Rhodospirillaceae bacterium]